MAEPPPSSSASKRARADAPESRQPPPRPAAYGPRRGGNVYEIQNLGEDIRAHSRLRLVLVKRVNNKKEAWRYIAERLGDPFLPNQYNQATSRYNGVPPSPLQLIIPDAYEPPYSKWVSGFRPAIHNQHYIFILDVSFAA
jgi:hypothetical protein